MTFSKRAQAISGLGGDKWALHFAAKEKIESGQDIISLSIGEPELLPPPMLGEVAKSAIDAGRVGYTNGPGELALRKILADKYTERAQRLISTDQVLITAG
ncbi:MAG: pyridoxal phosphate-dependent aminotransferase, partial [Alphaproteobacteria bacterium]